MKMVIESSVVTSPTTVAPLNQISTTSTASSTISTSTSTTGNNNCQSNPQFNPQSLGREFVRQYYTVLNEGPHIMHRFYSDDSSLVHGGPNNKSEVVYGQAEINSKIMSLNFKDCHTKIRQVDSMETVGKGVVIQVIGELSNNGKPMRKFFQTFVLAPRSASNYYVRNDIFRYQDEVFAEEEEDVEAEIAEEQEQYEEEGKPQAALDKEEAASPRTVKEPMYTETIGVNGNVSHDVLENEKAGESEAETSGGESKVGTTFVQEEWEALNNNTTRQEEEREDLVSSVSEENTSPLPAQNMQNEPLSYASMVNKNPPFSAAPPFANAPTNFVTKPSEPIANVVSAPFINNNKNTSENSFVTPVSPVIPVTNTTVNSTGKPPVSTHGREHKGGRARGHQGGKPRNDSREVTPAYNDNDSSYGENNEFGAGGRRQQFADDQQVFVGNLMQDITEDQLRQFFAKYGTIIDVRINRTNQKAGRTPNYGFVTFNDASVVKEILNQKPIYFNDHRFNVEEKRSQSNRASGERSGRDLTRSGSGGGNHNLNSNRIVNNTPGNTGPRAQSGGGSGPRRDRSERNSQSFGGNEGRRNGGGSGGGSGGPNRVTNYNRR